MFRVRIRGRIPGQGSWLQLCTVGLTVPCCVSESVASCVKQSIESIYLCHASWSKKCLQLGLQSVLFLAFPPQSARRCGSSGRPIRYNITERIESIYHWLPKVLLGPRVMHWVGWLLNLLDDREAF